jgi:hypothetical protein
MSKHTEGPWIANEETLTVCTRGGGVIADIWTEVSHEPKTVVANTRLIAAAPDLLEACKKILELCDENDCFETTREMVRHAIKKAEGVAR